MDKVKRRVDWGKTKQTNLPKLQNKAQFRPTLSNFTQFRPKSQLWPKVRWKVFDWMHHLDRINLKISFLFQVFQLIRFVFKDFIRGFSGAARLFTEVPLLMIKPFWDPMFWLQSNLKYHFLWNFLTPMAAREGQWCGSYPFINQFSINKSNVYSVRVNQEHILLEMSLSDYLPSFTLWGGWPGLTKVFFGNRIARLWQSSSLLRCVCPWLG